MRYIVSYDLHTPGKDYQTLWDELKRLNGFRCLESVWSVDVTSQSAAELRNHLRSFVDSSDRLLALRLGDWATWNAINKPE